VLNQLAEYRAPPPEVFLLVEAILQRVNPQIEPVSISMACRALNTLSIFSSEGTLKLNGLYDIALEILRNSTGYMRSPDLGFVLRTVREVGLETKHGSELMSEVLRKVQLSPVLFDVNSEIAEMSPTSIIESYILPKPGPPIEKLGFFFRYGPKVKTELEKVMSILRNHSVEFQDIIDKKRSISEALKVIKLKNLHLNLPAETICDLLYNMKNLSYQVGDVHDTLILTTEALDAASKNIKHSPDKIARMIYGLRLMDSRNVAVRQVVQAVSKYLAAANVEFTPTEAAYIIRGLSEMSSSHQEVRKLIAVAKSKIISVRGTFNALQTAEVLASLNRFEETDEQVPDLFIAVKKKMSTDRIKLDMFSIVRAISGISKLSGRNFESKSLVLFVINQMKSTDDKITAEALGKFLAAIKNFGHDRDIAEFLGSIHDRVKDIHDFRMRDIANCLLGLSNSTADQQEVRQFLSLLATKIDDTEDQFSPSSFCDTLYGLRCLSSEHLEVKKILLALVSKLKMAEPPRHLLDSRTVGRLHALRFMSSEHKEVSEFVDAVHLLINLDNSGDNMDQMKNLEYRKILRWDMHNFSNLLYGLQNCRLDDKWGPIINKYFAKVKLACRISKRLERSSELYDGLASLFQTFAIIDKSNLPIFLSLCDLKLDKDLHLLRTYLEREFRDHSSPVRHSKSVTEDTYKNLVVQVFSDSDTVSVSTNEMLFGFEADIVLRIRQELGRVVRIVNIEIDGFYHQRSSVQFSNHRDKYLTETHGVEVIRIDLASTSNRTAKSHESFIKYVKSLV